MNLQRAIILGIILGIALSAGLAFGQGPGTATMDSDTDASTEGWTYDTHAPSFGGDRTLLGVGQYAMFSYAMPAGTYEIYLSWKGYGSGAVWAQVVGAGTTTTVKYFTNADSTADKVHAGANWKRIRTSFTLATPTLVTVKLTATDAASVADGVLFWDTAAASPPTLDCETIPTFTEGVAISPIDFDATGGTAPLVYSATGLPAGLTINSSTGVVSGTPTTAGTSSVVVTVTDAAMMTDTCSASWVVSDDPPDLSCASLSTVTVGTPVSVDFNASGGAAPLVFSATGLPPGVSINSGTGVVSGTPTTAGSYSVVVTVTDDDGATDTCSSTWNIDAISGGGIPADQWAGAYVVDGLNYIYPNHWYGNAAHRSIPQGAFANFDQVAAWITSYSVSECGTFRVTIYTTGGGPGDEIFADENGYTTLGPNGSTPVIKYELAVGRNGFIQVNGVALESANDSWPSIPHEAFESLLDRPDGSLPVTTFPAPFTSYRWLRLEDKRPDDAARLRQMLELVQESIGTKLDAEWRELIPRCADLVFDEDVGGSSGGGGSSYVPVDHTLDSLPGAPQEDDSDGDGVPDHQDPEPNNAAVEGLPEPQGWFDTIKDLFPSWTVEGTDEEWEQEALVVSVPFYPSWMGWGGYGTFRTIPDSTTPGGAALNAARLLCRSFGVLIVGFNLICATLKAAYI